MKKVLVILAILVAAAACGGSGSTASSNTSGSTAPQPYGASGGGTPSKISGQPADTANPPINTVVPAIQGPQVIRQAQLTIDVSSGSFDSKLASIRALVQLELGFISGTDAQASPANPNDQIRSGVITFMVPAAKFDETIDQLTRLGKVQNEHISGNDVSAQYVDLQARLANEEAQRNAMLALLGKAQSVADIIAVQTQLGQITQQIEQLKGQISYIDHNTTYSTVSVNITEAGAPAQAQPVDSWGFASALKDAAHNFVTTINYVITGLGAIGPIVIVLGLGYLLWRRRGSPLPRRA
jgi:ABC-type Fe3+-hydroxamate transport system substrate-binding protein